MQLDMPERMNSLLEELDIRTFKTEDDILSDDKDGSSPPKRQRRGLKMEVFVPMEVLRYEHHPKAEEDYKKTINVIHDLIHSFLEALMPTYSIHSRMCRKRKTWC